MFKRQNSHSVYSGKNIAENIPEFGQFTRAQTVDKAASAVSRQEMRISDMKDISLCLLGALMVSSALTVMA